MFVQVDRSIVSQDDLDLLADIRNFVAFQVRLGHGIFSDGFRATWLIYVFFPMVTANPVLEGAKIVK